jgi:hypothetical protein
MKRTLKKQWVAGLRSGKYKQGRNFLCNGRGKMCCLGVLGDIALDGHWVKGKTEHPITLKEVPYWYLEYKGKIVEFEFGPDILDELGLPIDDQIHLVALNDDQQKSFFRIANWIEANVPEEND